jgi:hypothetical protein
MYDDQHVYSRPGENWAKTTEEKKAMKKEAEKMKAGAPENADLKDSEPMGAKGEDEGNSLVQRRVYRARSRKDTYDQDPNTTSMYDDGHVYTDKAGSLNWKFAGGPTEEFKASQTPAPKAPEGAAALVQRHRHRKDTYDQDPNTTSMYDDGHVYTDKAGSLTWKFAGGPTKEFEASQTPAPKAPEGAAAGLAQRRHHYMTADAFDRDPDTASMYDD